MWIVSTFFIHIRKIFFLNEKWASFNASFYIKSQRPLFAFDIAKIGNVSNQNLDNRLCAHNTHKVFDTL